MTGSFFQLNVFVKELNTDFWPDVIEKLNTLDIYCSLCQSERLHNSSSITFIFKYKGAKAVLLNNETFTTKIQFGFDKIHRETMAFGQYKQLDKLLRLSKTNYVLTFGWEPEDYFSLRFAFLISAIITEQYNGICFSPSSGLWQKSGNIIDEAMKEVINYEKLIFTGLLQEPFRSEKTGINNSISTASEHFGYLN